MYREPRLTVLRSLLTTLTALCAIIALPGVEAASKRALLIGIDDYKEVSDLKGCVNDVELIKSDLVSKFGFPEDNVKTLKNQDATHAGIVAGIRQHLIANAQQGDVVLLHFSGHGSQTRDEVGGDEIDGYDETLVAHDSRTPGVFDITDDQINGLMQELTAKTDHDCRRRAATAPRTGLRGQRTCGGGRGRHAAQGLEVRAHLGLSTP
jgi:uncharacterized caspase-like protein